MICGMSVQIITSVKDLLAAWIIAGKTLVLHGLLNKPIKAQKGRLKPINVALRGWEGHEKKKEVGRRKKKQLTVSSALINVHLQPSFRNIKCLKTENRNVNHKMGRTGLCVASIAAFNETLWSGLEVRLIHGNNSCRHFAIKQEQKT